MRWIFVSGLVFTLGCSGSSESGGAGGSGATAGSSSGGSSGTSGNGGSGGGGAASCVPAPPDDLRASRDSCTFKAGAKVADTLHASAGFRASLPIQHVVVLMKENRSYDEFFGQLSKQGQPDSTAVPDSWVNKDDAGVDVKPFHQTNTCFKQDPGHQWAEMHDGINDGAMDGFVKSGAKSGGDGHFVMGYYDQTDLPFYYFLANTFSIGDHHFASARTGTWPNRDFLYLATPDTCHYTGDLPFPTAPSLFDALKAAGVSYMVYSDGVPLGFSLGWFTGHEGTAKMQDYYDALTGGTLPSVVFVDGGANTEDEHPPADVQKGEAWTKKVYDALRASSAWDSSAFILTYDEAGGFADHLAPPSTPACVPDAKDTDFTELGVRVPLLVASPYAKRHHVSHAVHEHSSITRFIQMMFDLPAMTARDANSDALLDMFDFCTTPADVPAAVEAGTAGCP